MDPELPVRVFQFWDAEIPDDVAALVARWRDVKHVEHHLVDDGAAVEFLDREYGARVRSAYQACLPPAMRADVVRYALLHTYGGLYVDADIRRKRGVLGLVRLAGERGALLMRGGHVANDLMVVSRPGDPLMIDTLEQAVSNIERRVSNNVWEVTGPGIMTTWFRDPDRAARFEGFALLEVNDVDRFVRFEWGLPYKAGDRHWLRSEGGDSIFRDS
jgi:mannosyltransferase OCH1-like enzyme